MNTKVRELCADYVRITEKINGLESFVSTDVAKQGMNFYSLGSAYRELYGVMLKLSYAGYVQTTQVDALIEEYKNESKSQGIDPTVGISLT